MTKFKQGDRVVPERFENGTNKVTWDHIKDKYVGISGEVTEVDIFGNCKVHGWLWPSSALRPASPKWEPKVGEEYEFSQQVTFQTFRKCIFIVIDGENYVGRSVDDLCYYGYPYIRPIAPSLEEEVGSILCKLIGGDNYILRDAKADIMAIFNRHKEGEGLKEYIQHLPDCVSRDMTGMIDRCTCGLDQLLTTNPKEERK